MDFKLIFPTVLKQPSKLTRMLNQKCYQHNPILTYQLPRYFEAQTQGFPKAELSSAISEFLNS